jgi:S-adenosylmethionine:tRNA ribosyltransferase-isomerase
MKTKDFFFELPQALIAQEPAAERGTSRLMVLDRNTGGREHRVVAELPELLEASSLLVFNNSKVRRARLKARSRATGAGAEFLLLRKQDSHTWQVMTKRLKRRTGSRYIFSGQREGEITGGEGGLGLLRFDSPISEEWLEQYGHTPLPPYIRRDDTELDRGRYQTVYAKTPGSAAAPTAGLHFTDALLERLRGKGIETAFITLHVGLGTFLPVRSENIEDHLMHEESFTIDERSAELIEKARAQGRRITAVGTTSVRALESAWDGRRLRRGEGSTSIFIYPGYEFKVVNTLFTNFHTPESTLLMLVSAFAAAPPFSPADKDSGRIPGARGIRGREWILESYALAVREGYKFFSYGDAMLIK